MEGCQIKRGRDQEYEIILNRTTKVMPSQRKLFATGLPMTEVPLGQLHTIKDGKLINTRAMVKSIRPRKTS